MPTQQRGFYSSSSNVDRVRTHLFFSSQTEHHTARRKRRTHNKLHQLMHRKDEMVQTTPAEFEPDLWSGNQRVTHFGPMAQRDPFFYYYPKGWDILYPAHFGFFPYRASKFRGSSSTVCMGAFGGFFCIGGALMVFLGFFSFDKSHFWPTELTFKKPIQIAGPILLFCGLCLLLAALASAICSLKIFNVIEKKRGPPRVTIWTQHFKEPVSKYERPPYQPLPPPAYPVLANKYVQAAVFNPRSELKLYPPVMPGFSTLSLHGRSPSIYTANPYNTLRAVTTYQHQTIDTVGLGELRRERASSAVIGHHRLSDLPRRSKSIAFPLKNDRIKRQE